MAVTRFKLNLKGFRQLRTSPEMDALILKHAKAGARSHEGLEAKQSPGKNRARAVIIPGDAETALEVQKDPSIMIRALSASRHA